MSTCRIWDKGYGSTTSAYSAAKRVENADKESNILYLGDHDPSGLDMVRDVNDRLKLMKVNGFHVKHIALTTEQVNKYNPPKNNLKKDNFGKLTDPRGISYLQGIW